MGRNSVKPSLHWRVCSMDTSRRAARSIRNSAMPCGNLWRAGRILRPVSGDSGWSTGTGESGRWMTWR